MRWDRRVADLKAAGDRPGQIDLLLCPPIHADAADNAFPGVVPACFD
jgi:hypothetical protein